MTPSVTWVGSWRSTTVASASCACRATLVRASSAPRYRVRLIGLGGWLGGSFDPEEGGVHVRDVLGAVDQGFELGQAGRVVPAQGSYGVTGVDQSVAGYA